MKISFDLDDTLIPFSKDDFPVEKKSLFQKLLSIEPLRSGTRELVSELKQKGHCVGVYTTSYRKISTIRFQLMTYKIWPDFVINEAINRRELNRSGIHSSKYPSIFGIDLHIDDSEGVAMEAERLGFKVIVVSKADLDWALKIKNYISLY